VILEHSGQDGTLFSGLYTAQVSGKTESVDGWRN
jgi:hypothetical protein